MQERNRLINGRFLQDLNGWTVSGAMYSAGDGDDHFGVAVLSTGGDYILQSFSVPDTRVYSIHLAAKAVSEFSGSEVTLVIEDGPGNAVVTKDISIIAATWTETTWEVGLAPGTNYELKIINNTAGEDVSIDDVWLWHVPLTRAEVASRVNTKLARLATERSLSTTPSGLLTEGDYTYPVDAGLRGVGAINPETGLPDPRYIDPQTVGVLLDLAEKEILEQLHNDYLPQVDLGMGPRKESFSQIAKGIGDKLGIGEDGAAGINGPVVMRKLRRDNG